MKTFYHITFHKLVPKILMEGIVPQKKRIWANYAGSKLGLPVVYAYDDYETAFRWCYKQAWDFKKKTVILVFKEDESIMKVPDTYIFGKEFYKEGIILPENIIDVLDVGSEKFYRVGT